MRRGGWSDEGDKQQPVNSVHRLTRGPIGRQLINPTASITDITDAFHLYWSFNGDFQGFGRRQGVIYHGFWLIKKPPIPKLFYNSFFHIKPI